MKGQNGKKVFNTTTLLIALSAYGLGLFADMGGWNAVFWLLFSLCVIAVGISVCYGVINVVRRKKNERMA